MLAQFPLTRSETAIDYYHLRVNIRIASWVENKLKPSIWENHENVRKPIKSLYIRASACPLTRSESLYSCARKLQNIISQKLDKETHVK